MKYDAKLALMSILALAYSSAHADGAVHRVANYGVDSPTCGASSRPCRSINQAMDNAVAGDTILVGIGRYGDINGDGDLFDAGDERDSGLGCLICVTKPLRFISDSGALGTVIDAGVGNINTGVSIRSGNVAFGGRDRGFTITNASVTGLMVIGPVSNVSIVGNIAIKNLQSGFHISGYNNFGIRSLKVADNIASNNGDGITVSTHSVDGGTFQRNTAVGNVSGAYISGRNIRVLDNVIDGNNQGMSLNGIEVTVTGNTVTNSGREGLIFYGEDVLNPDITNLRKFSFNTVVGNRGPGISIGRYVTATSISYNNVFGNGTSPTIFTIEPRPNCGLLNVSGFTLIAVNNFWGLPTGPGPDPADGVCDINSSNTVVNPVRSSPIENSGH